MDLLERLFAHDRWAMDTLLACCETLGDEQLDRRFDIGHQTVRETLGHVALSMKFWTQAMSGNPMPDPGDDRSVVRLKMLYLEAIDGFIGVARELRDEDRLDDTFVGHFGLPMSFAGAILHVMMHNDEHRADLSHMLQRLEIGEIPEVDHAIWDNSVRATLA